MRQTVSHDPTRKSFLAKVLGLAVVAAVIPKSFAKNVPVAAGTRPRIAPAIRPAAAARTVARRADSF
jgi:hypothetical protein